MSGDMNHFLSLQSKGPDRHTLEEDATAGITAIAIALSIVDRSKLLTNVELFGFSESALLALFTRCPNITTFKGDVTDCTAEALGKYCPRLTSFWASPDSQCTEAGVIALANGCPQLAEVVLKSDRVELRDGSVEALARCNLKGLRIPVSEPFFSHVTEQGILRLASSHRLTRVDLTNHEYAITNASIAVLAGPHLQDLNISILEPDRDPEEDPSRFNDEGLLHLANHSPNLQKVWTCAPRYNCSPSSHITQV